MYQILMAEDSIDYQSLVSKFLRPIAEVTTVSSISEALQVVNKKKFDLFLIDIGLEDGDGFTLTSKLKQNSDIAGTPFIFLTARNEIDNKKIAFSLGAEDYIVKPFDSAELQLRIERRLGQAQKLQQELKRGQLRLDVSLQKAFLSSASEDENIGLTPMQFKLLFYLITQEPNIISREKLMDAVWGSGVHVGRSIDTHINSLRRKLGEFAFYIQTVYGQGYRFLLK
jgi:DNA-binding response OmpR family regulator